MLDEVTLAKIRHAVETPLPDEPFYLIESIERICYSLGIRRSDCANTTLQTERIKNLDVFTLLIAETACKNHRYHKK